MHFYNWLQRDKTMYPIEMIFTELIEVHRAQLGVLLGEVRAAGSVSFGSQNFLLPFLHLFNENNLFYLMNSFVFQ